jgi:hypothetical protein
MMSESPVRVDPVTGEVTVRKLTPAIAVTNVLCAVVGTLFVAPLVAVVDGSIINSVNGDKTPVLQGIKNGYKSLVFTPIKFFRKEWFVCGLCWMVYSGTYGVVNNVRSFAEVRDLDHNTADALKFATSLVVNLGLTQVKDVLLVKEFAKRGASYAKAANVPLMSRGLFLCRDSLTMFATFSLAERIGSWLYQQYSTTATKKTCMATANFVAPAAVQPLCTFFHLWALENAAALQAGKSQNLADLRQSFMPKYGISTVSRVARIMPAISIGNNINIELRQQLLYRFA